MIKDLRLLTLTLAALFAAAYLHAAPNPLEAHGRLQIAKSGTHLEHADATPFFFLADTCWCGPALSGEADWETYLKRRRQQGFTAIQFNMVSPWRTATTDAEGRRSYTLRDDNLTVNEAFYAERLDSRLRAINRAGLLAVPVLCWANKAGDAGVELSEEHVTRLIRFQIARYADVHALWILAGDNRYQGEEADRWKRIGRSVFAPVNGRSPALVTTHPTGENWPWGDWENESWLTVLGYQSGHGDGAGTLKWLHSGPPATYGKRTEFTRPVINLEPAYEDHVAYQSRRPHSDLSVRRAVYWSLLVNPVAGVTYGGHGVWSWHTKPGEPPTDHGGSGVAKIWKEAMELPGANQMAHARAFFESLPWTQLRPANDLLTKQDPDPAKFVACAATPDRSVVVAYTPPGTRPAFKDPSIKPQRCFDPRTGKWQTADPPVPDPALDWLFVFHRRP
jgi:hypothetical protein